MPNYFIVDNDETGLGSSQVCKCGCENVHLKSIEAFCRHEDCDITFYEIDMQDGLKGIIEKYPEKECPSPRRNALIVYFYCEDGCEFSLVILQHKGNNMIDGHSVQIPFDDDEFEVIE